MVGHAAVVQPYEVIAGESKCKSHGSKNRRESPDSRSTIERKSGGGALGDK